MGSQQSNKVQEVSAPAIPNVPEKKVKFTYVPNYDDFSDSEEARQNPIRVEISGSDSEG